MSFSSPNEELVRVLKRSEEVVSVIREDSMRAVAFAEVLRLLLSKDLGGTVAPRISEKRVTSHQPRSAAGAAGRILALRDGGFFSAPKTIAETQNELRRLGYPYEMEKLSTPLVRLVRRRQLRRLERREGGKTVYEYCNP